MGVRHMTGTPFHIEKLPNPDGRRHRARCVYYQKNENHCKYSFGVCIGASHCPYYQEKSVEKNKNNFTTKSSNTNQSNIQLNTYKKSTLNSCYTVGMRVLHKGVNEKNSYGYGTIKAITDKAIRIDFDSGTTKLLQLTESEKFLSIIEQPFKAKKDDENIIHNNESVGVKDSKLYPSKEECEREIARLVDITLNRGVSVTKRISQIKQPYGGYVPPSSFSKKQLEDNCFLYMDENLAPSIIGTAVDYLSRFMLEGDPWQAFGVSLQGAVSIKKQYDAELLVSQIKGLDDESIVAACKLCGFDVCIRSSRDEYKPIEEIMPNINTISNIRIMVNRVLSFVKQYGPIIKTHLNFSGGYTNIVSSGDGDFCTEDTIWELKVLKNSVKTKHTLQILMYYIMGQHSQYDYFKKIKKLGFFNPRLNMVYTLDVSLIKKDIIFEIERNVIGYPIDTITNQEVLVNSQMEALSNTQELLSENHNCQEFNSQINENKNADCDIQSISSVSLKENYKENIADHTNKKFFSKFRKKIYVGCAVFIIILIIIGIILEL